MRRPIIKPSPQLQLSTIISTAKPSCCRPGASSAGSKASAYPRSHLPRQLVTVGRNGDLNKAMDDASWDMINLLEQEKKLTRLDAYALASMVMDCRLAAPRGTDKAVHCLVPKGTWVAAR
jgi:acetamidase/formamidase